MRDFDGVGDIIEYRDHYAILDSINKPKPRCKLICLGLPPVRLGYAGGKKYCAHCKKFYFTENVFCICCGRNLRTRPVDKNLPMKRKKTRLHKQDNQ